MRLVYDGLMAAPFLRLNDDRFPPGWVMYPHAHSFIQLIYVVAGRGVHVLDGEQAFGPGDIIIIAPGARHRWRAGQRSWLELIDVGLDPNEPRHRSLIEPLVEAGRAAPAGVLHETVPLRPLAEAIRLALSERAAFADIRIHGLLWQLLADVGRASRERRGHEQRSASPDEVIDALERFIAAHHGRHLTLGDLAAAVHVSPKHLCRIVSRSRGVSPMRLLSAARMHRAGDLLGSSDAPIAEVAAAVGLPDARHFSRLFKAAFGQTPAAYRTDAGPA
ncbi:MAG: AraC family transcriptional regulator [Minicystis sp.]